MMSAARSRDASSRLDASPVSVAFPNTMAGLKQGSHALAKWLRGMKASVNAEDRARLVFDEIVTNIIRYAFPNGAEHAIQVSFALHDGGLTLVFEDDGVPFDPCTAPEPAPAGNLADAELGGRGLILVRKAARHLHYARDPAGRNCLTVTLAGS